MFMDILYIYKNYLHKFACINDCSCGTAFYYRSSWRIGETGCRLAWFQGSAAKKTRTALFRDVTQRVVVTPYRRLGKTYRYQLLVIPCRRFGTDRLSETSVRNDHYLLHNSAEERSSHTDKFLRIKEALIIVPSDIPISKCVTRTNDVNKSGFVVRIDQSRVQHTQIPS
jgi:hypothetical protein